MKQNKIELVSRPVTYQMVSTHLDHQRVDMVGADAGAWDAVVVDDIPGTSTSKSVYDLRPNSTYSFSLCAGDYRQMTYTPFQAFPVK